MGKGRLLMYSIDVTILSTGDSVFQAKPSLSDTFSTKLLSVNFLSAQTEEMDKEVQLDGVIGLECVIKVTNEYTDGLMRPKRKKDLFIIILIVY